MPSQARTKPRDALAAFHPAVGDWFRSALGEPTRSQALAWPHIARGDTTLLLAPTGSGKTLAAFLSAIDRLAREPRSEDAARTKLRVLYVSPLKALAVDVERNLRAPLAGVAEAAARLGTPLRRLDVAVRTGDTTSSERAKILRAPPDILITTPESLYLLLTSAQREMLASVDTIIIDEIHQMAASKRGAHLFLSLERLEAMRPDKPLQRIGLSATQRPLDEIARLLGGFDVANGSETGSKITKASARAKAAKRHAVPTPRPVAIVDASAKKALSITVEVPPPLVDGLGQPIDDDDDPDVRSIWPQLHARLVERIRAARSTMIFVNSRRLAERLATALNETAGEELALAHHGSVAKDARRAIEERLKAGQLPAIVATSSLELGIDMGAVDQVIQVEAPPSVASGIQRIGRASHHVGGVPSGVLVPKHKHDLLACAAAAAGIESGDVEDTYYARNPLDVLAQQIVAIASVGIPRERGSSKSAKRRSPREEPDGIETDVEALWNLVRRAAPFTDLPRTSFEGVLDMLAGRYPSDEFADLRPRITWDRTRGVISARAGSKRLSVQNAGTIPDRGLYGVFLQDGSEPRESDRSDRDDDGANRSTRKSKSSRRVGELDEEMVFELREGEVFLLGASSWRAEQITRDRVLVTPATGVPGKMPFWHGDRAGRSLAFGTRIGQLTRTIASLGPSEAATLLARDHHLDNRSADDLIAYVKEELAAASAVPSDRTIVVERVPDELGDLRICVLTPFGSRVHAPWAMAALRKLRDARAGDIEAVATDDGIVFRVPGGEEPPPLELLFPSPDEIEDVVTRELAGSSLFAARFREAAARALLLPRQHVGKRTPLWAQRKRAADLLAVAQRYPAFPIVLETYRECLRDAFDLPALVEVLRRVESRRIRIATVDLATPSPMAGSLLFSFVGNFIYDEDAPAAERRAQALTIDHAQLRELLGETELRKLLDPDIVLEHVRQLQRLDRPLRHADAVHDLLLWLGDVSEDELQRRIAPAGGSEAASKNATADMLTSWIADLLQARRIVRARIAGEERFVAVEDIARYRDALGVIAPRGLPDAFVGETKDSLTTLVARYARTHGPFRAKDVADRWGLGEGSILATLERLVASGKIVTGAFLPSPSGSARRSRTNDVECCDAEVLRVLKRKTLARLRKSIEPVSADTFGRFLVEWQGIVHGDQTIAQGSGATIEPLLRAIGQLEGCPIPASVLESEVLPARVPGYRTYMLDQLLASGEVVWAGIEPIGANDGRVALYLADREPLLARSPKSPDLVPRAPIHDKLRALFERRGALFFAEITRTLGVYPADVLSALWDLVWAGEVTNDTLEPLRSALSAGLASRGGRRNRQAPRPARLGPRGSEGRWSLRRARWEREPSSTERATAIARGMLERYGIVLREAAHAEGLPGGFSNVYDVYRALEDQGRVRRGYFVAERGATQFALPGAEERLRATRPDDEKPRTLVLAATDPANPWGSLVPWPGAENAAPPISDDDVEAASTPTAAPTGVRPQRAPGARVILHDGKLLAWLGRGGHNLVTFLPRHEPDASHAIAALAEALVMLSRKRGRPAMLVSIDGVPSVESPLAGPLAAHGFLPRRGALVHIPPRPRRDAPEGRRGERARFFAERGGSLQDAAIFDPASEDGAGFFDDDDDLADLDDSLEAIDEAPEDGAPNTAGSATADPLPDAHA